MKWLDTYNDREENIPSNISIMDSFKYTTPIIDKDINNVRFIPQDIAHIGIKKALRNIPKNIKYDWDGRSDIARDNYKNAHENDRFVNEYFNNSTSNQKQTWLDKYETGGNLNDSKVKISQGFKGEGYNTKGRNYSPAWGGQFKVGGSLKPIDQNTNFTNYNKSTVKEWLSKYE